MVQFQVLFTKAGPRRPSGEFLSKKINETVWEIIGADWITSPSLVCKGKLIIDLESFFHIWHTPTAVFHSNNQTPEMLRVMGIPFEAGTRRLNCVFEVRAYKYLLQRTTMSSARVSKDLIKTGSFKSADSVKSNCHANIFGVEILQWCPCATYSLTYLLICFITYMLTH